MVATSSATAIPIASPTGRPPERAGELRQGLRKSQPLFGGDRLGGGHSAQQNPQGQNGDAARDSHRFTPEFDR